MCKNYFGTLVCYVMSSYKGKHNTMDDAYPIRDLKDTMISWIVDFVLWLQEWKLYSEHNETTVLQMNLRRSKGIRTNTPRQILLDKYPRTITPGHIPTIQKVIKYKKITVNFFKNNFFKYLYTYYIQIINILHSKYYLSYIFLDGGYLARFFILEPVVRHTVNTIIYMIHDLLNNNTSDYILLGKFQTYKLESRFGQYIVFSGCNYLISVPEVMQSEKSRASNLFSRFNLHNS